MSEGVATPRKGYAMHNGQELEARFTVNGLCAVEESFGGQSLEAIGQEMASGRASFVAVRSVFRAMFLAADPGLTDIQAGKMLQELGADNAGVLIQAAFNRLQSGAAGVVVELPDLDQRGRLAFEAIGRRFVLAFHFNAMAELEPIFPGMSMVEIAQKLAVDVSVTQMRALFRASLIDHLEVSLWGAGELMEAIGMATVSSALGKAFEGAFPKVEPVPEKNGDQVVPASDAPQEASQEGANPTRRRRRKGGTGTT